MPIILAMCLAGGDTEDGGGVRVVDGNSLALISADGEQSGGLGDGKNCGSVSDAAGGLAGSWEREPLRGGRCDGEGHQRDPQFKQRVWRAHASTPNIKP